MRTIKFRARAWKGGKFVFGDLLHKKNNVYIMVTHLLKINVDPETVAQFVGVDKNGAEIYEGDELVTIDGRIISATIDCKAFEGIFATAELKPLVLDEQEATP